MTLIDTAEVYGSEEFIGRAIAGQRNRVFLVILYHYVVEGELRIRVDGEDGEGLVLGAGDVVLLPRNDLHLVGSDLNAVTTLERLVRYADAGSGGLHV